MSKNLLNPRWISNSTSKSLDRRARRTRDALTNALFELMKEKPLSEIKVTELTRIADVNRATFYMHYQNVYDMYEQVKSELCQICIDLVESHSANFAKRDYTSFITDIFMYFSENAEVFTHLLGGNSDGTFLEDIMVIVRSACIDAVKPLEAVADLHPELASYCSTEVAQTLCNYQFDYIAGGIVSLLRAWVMGGCKESVSFMVQYATSLITATDAHIVSKAIAQSCNEDIGKH